jgi:hypothetical protein
MVLVLSFAAAVVAQEAPAPKAATARAAELLKELGQPDRCLDAARELVALGPAALPALHKALVDPRPEVVRQALFVASGLTGDIESLREPILRCLRHKDLGVALAARDAWPALDGGGATLVTDYHAGKALRLCGDETKEVVSGFPMLMGVQQLPDGHLLLAAYGQNRVVELDEKGEESWACTDVQQPSDAERLPDGHTLIADSVGLRVIEVDRAGQIVWTFDQDVRPIDVDRLANGNTLIASYKASGVVEVDRSGKVVWQWRAENVRDADRLLDGTTLITDCEAQCVLRVDSEHRTLRTWKVGFACNDAELLPNGHLVVGGDGAVVEFDHDGKEVWRAKVGYAGRVARHGVARR